MPDQAHLVIEESCSLAPSPARRRQVRRQLQRLSLMRRKMTPPGGLTTPQQMRGHWLQRADEMDRWAETPAETAAARAYRQRVEAASNADLWAEFLPFAERPLCHGVPATWW